VTDDDAIKISERIQKQHLLYGFIAETKFKSSVSDEICYTQGNGDSALWTGAYLAAEAFRYASTNCPTAFSYLTEAIGRISDLSLVAASRTADSEVAPTGFIARTIFPLDSPFKDKFVCDEQHNDLFPCCYRGKDSYWMGHPTRDQYAGVLFGLGVAYDLVKDTALECVCRDTIVQLTNALIHSGWSMSTPRSEIASGASECEPPKAWWETFITYPHHRLSILQLARHVDPDQFTDVYERTRRNWWWWWVTDLSLLYDVWVLRSKYYLLNLDHMYYYTLIRYEDDAKYKERYLKQFARIRKATRTHSNAHFNMIECALTGREPTRDAETISALEQLLCRGFRDRPVDLNGKYKACDLNKACDPIPVVERPYADFLWQRDPFGMKRDGDCSLESAGIDFILPYWMARCHRVLCG
jgi:hypothetical protein